jgi:hypothetical protein
MKDQELIKAEDLETINDELFGSFDPGDESGIGGGDNRTFTSSLTYTPSGPDGGQDWDYIIGELES